MYSFDEPRVGVFVYKCKSPPAFSLLVASSLLVDSQCSRLSMLSGNELCTDSRAVKLHCLNMYSNFYDFVSGRKIETALSQNVCNCWSYYTTSENVRSIPVSEIRASELPQSDVAS
jgi:hypothetical protein